MVQGGSVKNVTVSHGHGRAANVVYLSKGPPASAMHGQGQVQRFQPRGGCMPRPVSLPLQPTKQPTNQSQVARAVGKGGRRAGRRRWGWEILTIAGCCSPSAGRLLSLPSLPWPPSRSRTELRSWPLWWLWRPPPLPPGLVPRCLKWRRSARGST